MKRKKIYILVCNIKNIDAMCDKVFKNCKNKNKVYKWESIKDVLVVNICQDLINKNYKSGGYHNFIIYEPKKR